MIARSARVWSAAGLVMILLAWDASARAGGADVRPAGETRPAAPIGDADDACIWIHPTDPGRSLVIGTDKEHGLDVYRLDGTQVQHVEHGHMNNVDIRYGFPVGNRAVDLVAASNKDSSQSIALYGVDPEGRLADIAARPLALAMDAYGLCMYHSLTSGKYYVIVNSYAGGVEQWELFDNGRGKVDGRRVRQFQVGSRTEGCVCDDELGNLYIGEENVAIWKYPADPDRQTRPPFRQVVDILGPRGHLSDDRDHDIEGLALYFLPGGAGYLIASCQGAGSFSVYRREGENDYLGTFRIVADAGKGIDAVSNTDGIDVTNAGLGALFPQGLFVAQDGENTGGDQTNFKLVAFESIARAFSPPLQVNTAWDPRRLQKR
jgi:3-phytase